LNGKKPTFEQLRKMPTFEELREPQIEDVPLDPNKILEVLPPPQGYQKQPVLPMEPREQIPSLQGFVTPETLGGRIVRKGPQIIGGTAGGALGAAIPSIGEEAGLALGGARLGQWLFAPLFSALGGAGGRATTLNPRDPNYGRKLGMAALEEGGSEYIGRLLAAGAGRSLRFFRGTVEPGAEAADLALRSAGTKTARRPRTWLGTTGRGIKRKGYILLQKILNEPGGASRLGKRYGAHLLPGQSTEGIMDSVQAVAQASLFSGPTITRYETQTVKAALGNLQSRLSDNIKKNLISKVGTKRATAILSDLSNADSAALKAIETSLYKTIDDLADEAIDITPLKQMAEGLRGKGLKSSGREMVMRRINKLDSMQGFNNLKEVRSDLWQYGEKFARQGDNNDARIMKMLYKQTDDLMEQMAKRKGGALEAAWRTADDFHRGKLRTKWLADTFAKYGKAEDVATGQGFLNYIAKMSKEIEGQPSELVRMGFSANEIDQIKQVANATKFATKKATSGGMTMLVRLTQAGAIVGIPVGMATDEPVITYPSAFLLLGPELLARMILSPTGSKLLSTGLRAPAGSRSIGTLGTRLLREAAIYEYQRRSEGGKPQLWLRQIIEPKRQAQMPSVSQLRGFGGRGF